MTPDERRSWFPEDFADALESWFSSDIACCDSCHDEFVAMWPHAYAADEAECQRSSIPLDVFYEGSRLSEIYTRAEFDEFVIDIVCPRCGRVLGANMWPYDFPFDVDSDIEDEIKEIAELAAATPFLLLTHRLAKKVYDLLAQLAKSLSGTTFERPLYRARADNGKELEVLSAFDFPPPHVVSEGRYNHAGSPVLYLASDLDTCFAEMRQAPCIIAEIAYRSPLKALDLIDPFTSHQEFADDLSTLVYSALMSAKQDNIGWHKPEYVFSRFVADCARASGIQAIKYPSTRITANNFNLVIVDKEATLSRNGQINAYTRMPPRV